MGIIKTSRMSLEHRLQRVFENNASGQPVYIGESIAGTATSSAGWRISKTTYSGNRPATVKWADGDPQTFDKVWDNRATYTYS